MSSITYNYILLCILIIDEVCLHRHMRGSKAGNKNKQNNSNANEMSYSIVAHRCVMEAHCYNSNYYISDLESVRVAGISDMSNVSHAHTSQLGTVFPAFR